MRAWFARSGINVPPGAVVADADLTLDGVRRRFGLPAVAQRAVGRGGSGTYLLRCEDDVNAARAAEPDAEWWLVSTFLDGPTLNFHVLVHLDGSLSVSRPSLQFSGISEVGADFGAYCGCDFEAPRRFAGARLEQARGMVRAVGAGLAAGGYRGVFGVDVLMSDDAAVVLEVNARVQASTWLLGEIERAEGRVPLLAQHVLERHGRRTAPQQAADAAPGTQLGNRYRGPSGTVTRAPRSGIYALRDGRLVWRRPGFGLLECTGDEYLIVDVPRPGLLLHTGGTLGMLVTRHPLTRDDGHALNATGSRLVAAFRDMFAIEPDAVPDEMEALAV